MTSQRYDLRRGDALRVLGELPDASVDALITDPPYSSGGFTRGDRVLPASTKYVNSDAKIERAEFAGDNRDQRGFLAWCSLWLAESLRVVRPGSPVALFSDWRQLATVTDAIQAGGFVFRGIAVWDKGPSGGRPQMGRFRSSCEFVVWGSAGPMQARAEIGCLPGIWHHSVDLADKHHITGKPTPLMREIVKICPPGGVVLDPFMGSGTTGVAAIQTGRRFVGVEVTEANFDVAERRLRQACDEASGVEAQGELRLGGVA